VTRAERWRACPGFPAYEVSDRARVRRRATGKILRPYFVRKTYAAVGLRKGGATYKRLTARLMAAAFGGLPPGKQIHHRSGKVARRREILHGSRPHNPHSSEFKGVSFNVARKKFFACIKTGSRTQGLGLYLTAAQAAKVYDAAARRAWGKSAFQ
jgi:hypothetical protein